MALRCRKSRSPTNRNRPVVRAREKSPALSSCGLANSKKDVAVTNNILEALNRSPQNISCRIKLKASDRLQFADCFRIHFSNPPHDKLKFVGPQPEVICSDRSVSSTDHITTRGSICSQRFAKYPTDHKLIGLSTQEFRSWPATLFSQSGGRAVAIARCEDIRNLARLMDLNDAQMFRKRHRLSTE